MEPTPAQPVRRFTVPEELDGVRLDRALSRLAQGLSRTRLQEWILDGGVCVDGEVVRRRAWLLSAGQEIELADVPRSRERLGSDPAAELPIVHEDPHLVVVDKPAGMVVHPASVVRGGTVSERMEARYGPLPDVQGADRPGVVHRLDADTSGLLVLARTAEAGERLVALFRARRVEKLYLALVYGDPRFDSDWIETPIGRAPGRHDRMSTVPAGPGGKGREAATFYEVRERLGEFALLAIRPRTGRMHQIRVHLSSIGHPLLGDRLYHGGRRSLPRLPAGAPALGRHALHAAGLAFEHPATGERLDLEAPLPRDLDELLGWLRKRTTSSGS